MDQTAACDSLFFLWGPLLVLPSHRLCCEAKPQPVKRKFSQTATVANISHVHTPV